MTYHQVLIAVEHDPSKLKCLFEDLSEQNLVKYFVTPYRKGQDILSGNEIIPVSSVRKVHIVRTIQTNENEREAINQQSLQKIDELNRSSDSVFIISPGHGYEPVDILDAGQDVTSSFLNQPPGHTKPTLRMLNNPWIVSIGAGLMVAIIGAWLGLG